MKINKKIILLLSILLAILFVYIFSVSPKSILPESIAFIVYLFVYLAPISFLGYETCYMSGVECVSNTPLAINFIGPIILFIISTIIIYPIISFVSRIVLGLMYKDFSDKVFSLKYYKKLLIFIILIFILISFFYVNKMIETQKYENDFTITTTPEYVLREYYKFNIDYLNNRIGDDPSLGNRFVTNSFIEQKEKEQSKIDEYCAQNEICMPINPFICAQDFPENVSELVFKEIYKDENTAKFEVYIFEKPIIVTLVISDSRITNDEYGNEYGNWLIDEINCNR